MSDPLHVFMVAGTPYGSSRIYCSLFAPGSVHDHLKKRSIWKGMDFRSGNLGGYEFSEESIESVKERLKFLGMKEEASSGELWEKVSKFVP